PDVQLDPRRPVEFVPPRDLRPPRHTGRHLETSTLEVVVLVDLVMQRGPRADDAHLAAKHVPELRQLVERPAAKERTDARDSRVGRRDEVVRWVVRRSVCERPELEDLERFSVAA